MSNKSRANRSIRIALARTFGSGCMFRKSHAEDFVEKLGTIKTYKKFKEEKHYTSRQIRQLEDFMTLHHLKHRSEGGPTTEENGAIINELAHRYMHSLPRNQEEIINNYIREWKKRYYKKCDVQIVDDIPEQEFEIDLAEMEITGKVRIRKFDRAKTKRETKELIDAYFQESER